MGTICDNIPLIIYNCIKMDEELAAVCGMCIKCCILPMEMRLCIYVNESKKHNMY